MLTLHGSIRNARLRSVSLFRDFFGKDDMLKINKLIWHLISALSGAAASWRRSRSGVPWKILRLDYGFRRARKPPLDAEICQN